MFDDTAVQGMDERRPRQIIDIRIVGSAQRGEVDHGVGHLELGIEISLQRRQLIGTQSILKFVADPPTTRHPTGESADQLENLQWWWSAAAWTLGV
jgi:hypothetical protein